MFFVTINRYGRIRGWGASVFANPENRGWQVAASVDTRSLKVEGVFSETVNGVAEFDILLLPGNVNPDTGEIPNVGSITRAKPIMDMVIILSADAFQFVGNLAMSGNLRYFHCCFQAPRYNKGLIASASFGSRSLTGEE
jgi:hypothetical protein